MHVYAVGIWRQLLSKLTSWTMSYSKIHVITGPVFDLNYDGLWDPIDKIIRFVLNILSIDFKIYKSYSYSVGKLRGTRCILICNHKDFEYKKYNVV